MHIVLDSNIYISDHWMVGHHFQAFLAGAKKAGACVWVPEIVLAEVNNKYLLKARVIAKAAEQAEEDARRFLPVSLLVDFPPDASPQKAWNPTTAATIYEMVFLSRFKGVDLAVRKYPDCSHKLIAERAVEKRKPFKEDGRGYRDCLIWHSILEILEEGFLPVHFVTNNLSDFASEGALHPDLLADLKGGGHEPSVVVLHSSLPTFIEKGLGAVLAPNEHLRAAVLEGVAGGFSLRQWVQDVLLPLLHTRELFSSYVPDGARVLNHCSTSIDRLDPVSLWSVSTTQFLVVADLDMTECFEVVASYRTVLEDPDLAEAFPEVWERDEDDDRPLEGEISVGVKVRFSLLVDTAQDHAVSGEIHRIGSRSPHGWSVDSSDFPRLREILQRRRRRARRILTMPGRR